MAEVLMAMQLREMKPEYGMYLIFGTGLLIFFYDAENSVVSGRDAGRAADGQRPLILSIWKSC
ncbi:MAG: hypothetical protein V8S96_02670 [Lachnospiraceae bacterium]